MFAVLAARGRGDLADHFEVDLALVEIDAGDLDPQTVAEAVADAAAAAALGLNARLA